MRLPLALTALLSATLAHAAEPAPRVVKGETELTFLVGDRLVTRYVYAGTVQQEKSPATKPLAKPYFYPLLAPNGVSLTRDWPLKRGAAGETTDHFHQKSAWLCHGDVIPDGVALKTRSADKHVAGVDFWSEGGGHGRIVCVGAGEPANASDHAAIDTANEWRSADGDVILTEARTLRLTATPAGALVTVEATFRSPCGVTFGDTKEGSMGVRVRDEFALTRKGGTGVVTGPNGEAAKAPAKDNLPVWGQPANWHDYSGTIDGKTAGLAVFDATANPHRAAWHTRAYGLMAANPFARDKSGFPSRKGQTDPVKLAKGATLTLRYALYLHDGGAAAGGVRQAYATFDGGK